MGYLLDLDEVPEARLLAELERRRKARERGACDYCGKRRGTIPCRFTDRHCPDAG